LYQSHVNDPTTPDYIIAHEPLQLTHQGRLFMHKVKIAKKRAKYHGTNLFSDHGRAISEILMHAILSRITPCLIQL